MSSHQAVIAEFRMSAFVALHGLRQYLRNHPGVKAHDAVLSLKRSDSDYAGADFDVALRLHAKFPDNVDFIDPTVSLRRGLALLIELHKPWWIRFFPAGRQILATALTQDELQTFRSAGLFDERPVHEVVEWWDSFAALMRTAENERLSAQGRYAERLTLDHERKRLQSLGVAEEPRWTALEDNFAGYDVQSFDQTPYGLKNVLIEVKSSEFSPPRMILTRGEWEAAVQYGDAYVFHLWKLPSEELIVKSICEIAAHIPSDGGDGRWTKVEIQF